MDSMRSVLSVVFWITRLCEPANPPSQCQIRDRNHLRPKLFDFPSSDEALRRLGIIHVGHANDGGANRDRTDDLKLAKLALSQLSYGPGTMGQVACRGVARTTHFSRFASEAWWARDELNVRPHAYQACALTT